MFPSYLDNTLPGSTYKPMTEVITRTWRSRAVFPNSPPAGLPPTCLDTLAHSCPVTNWPDASTVHSGLREISEPQTEDRNRNMQKTGTKEPDVGKAKFQSRAGSGGRKYHSSKTRQAEWLWASPTGPAVLLSGQSFINSSSCLLPANSRILNCRLAPGQPDGGVKALAHPV